MPYAPFLEAAQDVRYDIELLGHRFRTSYEQVCHRLTTLSRPGAEGVPVHMVRIDVAGNISKRFSNSGFRFARFSGACPRWNEHAAFLTPSMVRVQLSEMPDGTRYFSVARTVRDNSGGFHAAHALHAVGIGCEVRYAKELVYADGIDLDTQSANPIGVACRVCERLDCEQRAFPPLLEPLRIDENRRGRSFYVTMPTPK
jgi:predicted transcriptional regulator